MHTKRIKKKYLGKTYDKYERVGALHWDIYYETPERSYKVMVDDSLTPFNDCEKGTVLDVGCGDGLLSFLLAEKGFLVTGIDVNKEGLKLFKEKIREKDIPGIKCRCNYMSAEDSVKGNKKFDYMLCVDVIEHLKDPKVIVKMMKNVNKFAVVITDHDLHLTKASDYHTTQFIPKEIEEMFKGYKLEKIPMRLKYFFGYKIYAKKENN